jgi:hypothetical protein
MSVSTELTVNPTTGELLDLAGTDTELLAVVVHEIAERRRETTAFEEMVEGELLARMDRDASWTQRIGGFELKAASPTAGTESYRADELEVLLGDLVDNGKISAEAASAACKRQLTLVLKVPWSASPQALADQVTHAVAITVGGHKVEVVSATGSVRPAAAGVKALRKVPGVSDALDNVMVVQGPARRRVKVTLKESA